MWTAFDDAVAIVAMQLGLPLRDAQALLESAIDRERVEISPKVTQPMIAVGDAIRSDLGLYAGGVTNVDAEYDERLGELVYRSPDVRRDSLIAWLKSIKATSAKPTSASTKTIKDFLRDLLASDPGMSREKCREAANNHFGERIPHKTIRALRNELRTDVPR